jgi:hypothetical protein
MSHILKKISVAGAGKGGNAPKPPVYKPPELGELQYGASHSFSETIDLLSDGPIEGIVDKDGHLLEGVRILQGIYLDDTPVAVSNKSRDTQLTEQESEAAELLNCVLANGTNTATKNLQRFFRELSEADTTSQNAKVTTLAGGREPTALEAVSWPNAPLYWRSRKRLFTFARLFNLNRGLELIGPFDFEENFSLRGFVKDQVDNKTFEVFINNTRLTGLSASNAEVTKDGGIPSMEHKDIFWLDNTTLGDANLMLSLYTDFQYDIVANEAGRWDLTTSDGELSISRGGGRNDGEYFTSQAIGSNDAILRANNEYFPESIQRVEEFIAEELTAILDLFNTNNTETGNVLQRQLAQKALSALGWNANDGGIQNLVLPTISQYEAGGEENPCLLAVVKVNETESSELTKNIVAATNAEGQIEITPMVTRPFGTQYEYSTQSLLQDRGVKFFDITCPTIGADGVLTGEMKGFVLLKIPLIQKRVDKTILELHPDLDPDFDSSQGLRRLDREIGEEGVAYGIDYKTYEYLKDIESFKYSKTLLPQGLLGKYGISDLKFNFSNVLAEFRQGTEYQQPLSFFSSVFIDHLYGRELFGPFNADKRGEYGSADTIESRGNQEFTPQRIVMNRSMLTRDQVLSKDATNYNLTVDENGLPVNEGSDDLRRNSRNRSANYSEWGKRSLTSWNEDAVPVVHTVYNPNVTKAFISLNVTALNDTLVFKVNPDEADTELDITSKFPAVLNIKVETGSLGLTSDGKEGLETPFKSYTYRIVALIEGSTIIDIGNPDYRGNSVAGESREIVVNLDGGDDNLNNGFELPPTVSTKQEILSADGEVGIEAGTIDSDSTEKRYVKITKLSFESNSVLLNKVVSLDKVTEIIATPLPYPFSAIVGTKLDSKSFSNIPRRTFDCKLKKVKIPSNYNPISKFGVDKRYYNSIENFDATVKANKLVYDGDWDGTFKEGLHWTDNPAWILYDLLTNYRYGMGSHIDSADINIFELYNIGRFCDAVDDQGFFVGVTDGRGGKEPRFSCNVVFDQGQKIFDAINTVAGLFRGRVFFGDSTISFSDDRPRTPVNLFTNESIKDGLFFYSNNRRDEQFNTIEVAYNDRFDNFVPKIEVVEDEDSIKSKGIFKKRIEGVGITSRAMARRVGQHQIFSKIKENQQVAFTAGLESLLCKPGDLILVEDELKTNKSNFGKVLDVDVTNQVIRVSNTFVDSEMNGVLTILNPTGEDTETDISTGFATLNRERYAEIKITGSDVAVPWSRYTGIYNFSGYKNGYPEASGIGPAETDIRYQNYALYTGLPESGTVLYFNTTVTGWVFASGTGQNNKSAFDLASGDFISELTGDQTLAAIGTGKIVELDLTQDNKRTTNAAKQYGFSGFDPQAYIGLTRGALVSDLDGLNPDQLSTMVITGTILSGPVEMEAKGFNHYGSVLSGFDRPELLPFVKLGSPARVQIKQADPFIYKVISMQEENVNEYLVTATKYDTGKFKLIEDDISLETLANTFSYQSAQTIGGITYDTLTAPSLYTVVSGIPDIGNKTFSITGGWGAVTNSTGYNVRLKLPNGNSTSINTTETGFQFDELRQVGPFRYSVNALGDKGGAGALSNTAFFDSQYDSSGVFVVYDDLLLYNRSFIERIIIY